MTDDEYIPESDEDEWTPEDDIGNFDIYCQLAVRLDRDASDRYPIRTQDVVTVRVYCPSEGGYHEITLMRFYVLRLMRALRFFESRMRDVDLSDLEKTR